MNERPYISFGLYTNLCATVYTVYHIPYTISRGLFGYQLDPYRFLYIRHQPLSNNSFSTPRVIT